MSLPIALACALGAAACTSTAVGGSGGSGGSAGGAGGVAHPLPSTTFSAIAGHATNDGGGMDPGMLYVELTNYGQGCGFIFPDDSCLSGDEWRVSIGIPPALQMPGSYPLSSPGIVTDSGGSGSGADDCCYCGGGSFSGATLEIVSIDATNLVVRLTNTAHSGFDVDGQYTAEICP